MDVKLPTKTAKITSLEKLYMHGIVGCLPPTTQYFNTYVHMYVASTVCEEILGNMVKGK